MFPFNGRRGPETSAERAGFWVDEFKPGTGAAVNIVSTAPSLAKDPASTNRSNDEDDEDDEHPDFKSKFKFDFGSKPSNASIQKEISTNECPSTELIIIKSVVNCLSDIFTKINSSSSKDVFVQYVDGKKQTVLTFQNLNDRLSHLTKKINSNQGNPVDSLIEELTKLLIDIYEYTWPIIEDEYIKKHSNHQDQTKKFSSAAVGFKALTEFSLAFLTILPSLNGVIFPNLRDEISTIFFNNLQDLYTRRNSNSAGGKPKKRRSTIRKTRRNKNKSRRY